MVKIRYSLAGRSGQRLFRIVVIDSRKKRDSGKYLDYLGFYNPNTKEHQINKEKLELWFRRGAQPTKTFKELLRRKSILDYSF